MPNPTAMPSLTELPIYPEKSQPHLDSGRPQLGWRNASAGSFTQPPGQADRRSQEPFACLMERARKRTALPGRPVSEEEIARAADLLKRIIHSPHPALAVARHLEEIDDLIPGLLELNIRQARADGRPDLAGALQNLLENIYLQLEIRQSEDQEQAQAETSRQPASLRLLFLVPAGDESPPRLVLLAEALSALGHSAALASEVSAEAVSDCHAVIAHHPHCDPRLLELLAACAAARKPILLNLDLDFEQMPLNHPAYEAAGLGTLARAKAYTASLLLADCICVPSLPMAASLQAAGYPVQVIPDGWSKANDLWGKPAPHRHTLNLGWIGAPGQLEDVALVRRIVVRVLREFPQTHLVIGGDPQVYQLFESVPECRRLFLPAVSYEDHPYLLSQVDILLAPLRNIPFNHSASDRWLVEAGARGIPWVASALPAPIAWGAGGLLASTLEEWHTHLRQLVLDEELRLSLGRAGRQQAQEREMTRLAQTWLDLIYSLLNGGR